MSHDDNILHHIKLSDDNPFKEDGAKERLEFGDEQHDIQLDEDSFHYQAADARHGSNTPFVPYPTTVPSPGAHDDPLAVSDSVQRSTAEKLSRVGPGGSFSLPEGGPNAPAPPPAQRQAPIAPVLRVSVHSPLKVTGPGMMPGVDDSYMTYAISTVTSLPGYAKSNVTVRRRFRDVVDLSDLLQLVFPGCFVPVRPDKDIIGGRRMESKFIDHRAQSIERFLNRLASHPALGPSAELRAFLEVDGELRKAAAWKALWPAVPGLLNGMGKFFRKVVGIDRRIPTPTEVSQRAVANRDLFLVVRERLAVARGQVDGEELTSPEEARLRGEATQLEELHKQLQSTCTKATELLRVVCEHGLIAGDLGVALMDMHKFEDKYKAPIGPPCGVAGQGSLKFFKLTEGAAGHMVGSLTQLHDTLHFMPAVFKALSQREHALMTVTTLAGELAGKRKALADFPLDATAKRRESLQQDSNVLEQSLVAARAEYRRVLERNLTDCQLFHLQRYSDFSTMLQQFLLVQKAYAEQARDVWVDVARTLGADKAAVAAAGMDPTINTAANNIYLM